MSSSIRVRRLGEMVSVVKSLLYKHGAWVYIATLHKARYGGMVLPVPVLGRELHEDLWGVLASQPVSPNLWAPGQSLGDSVSQKNKVGNWSPAEIHKARNLQMLPTKTSNWKICDWVIFFCLFTFLKEINFFWKFLTCKQWVTILFLPLPN